MNKLTTILISSISLAFFIFLGAQYAHSSGDCSTGWSSSCGSGSSSGDSSGIPVVNDLQEQQNSHDHVYKYLNCKHYLGYNKCKQSYGVYDRNDNNIHYHVIVRHIHMDH
jgi:hypothetical protein